MHRTRERRIASAAVSGRKSGSSVIEAPFAIAIVLLGLIMPMICLATLGMRYCFFLNASRQAVHAAAKAKSFEQDFSPDMSSQTCAEDLATTCCKAFSGVTLDKVITSIVITPIAGGESTLQTSKLTGAADEEKYLYQVQVQLIGKLSPLIMIPSSVLGGMDVPGLTRPYDIQTLSREVSENTQGLNK